MTITINNTNLLAEIKRSLSIIGKRSVDDEGNLLFKDITLSSREEGIVGDYINNAVNMLVAELAGFVTGTTGGIQVTFPANQNSNLESYIQTACNAYIIAYCLYSWFVITAPKIAAKYQGDADNQLAAIIRMTHEKKEATPPSSDYTDVTGNVTNN